MSKIATVRAMLRRRRRADYRADEYWEARADDLIETYDRPDTWDSKGWMRAGVEERIVPRLLTDLGARSVLVIGAGSGRQYEFLSPLDAEVRGFDIAPTLVNACRERHPEIETVVDTVVGADERHQPADVVLCTAVLQHVPPAEIEAAAASVQRLAQRAVIIRELTSLSSRSDYAWAHDYPSLFAGWTEVHREATDRHERYEVDLAAFQPVGGT